MTEARLTEPVDPARDHIRGDPAAPVTLLQYGDFECPYCEEAYGEVRGALRRAGDGVRFAFRHFPISEKHPHAELAAQAAEAAGAQGRFWEMHDRLYERGIGHLEREELLEDARALGLDADRVAAELDSGAHAARVAADHAGGETSGVTGTPGFFLNGERYTDFYDEETLTEVLRDRVAAVRR